MDIAVSIIAGLTFRAFFIGSEAALAKYNPALIGAWEGVVVHQLSSRSESEVDHFLAFGLRILIDHVISRDPSRTVMTVIWTTIGFIVSETLTPRSTLQPVRHARRDRDYDKRRRSSRSNRSLPSRVRAYQSPVSPESSSTARTAPTPIASRVNLIRRPSNTPKVPVHRPPTPPSFFLRDAESDGVSPIPEEIHPLELSPTRPPTGLAVMLEADDDTPPPRRDLLPTPPQSAPSENIDYTNGKEESPRRLSTIEELSSAEERSPNRAVSRDPPVEREPLYPQPNGAEPVNSNTPSEKGYQTRNGSPLPVPNFTLDGFSLSKPFNHEDSYDHENEFKHSTPFANTIEPAPMPVPNLTTSGWEPRTHQEARDDLLSPLSDGPQFGAPQDELLSPLSDAPEFASRPREIPQLPPPPQADDLLSPLSDTTDFDELRTPPRALVGRDGRKSRNEISDDPLRTPPALLSPQPLSPLFLDEPLVSGSHHVPQSSSYTSRSFGQPDRGFQPFAIDTGLDIDLDPPGSIPGSMPSPIAPLPEEPEHQGNSSGPETLISDRTDATSALSTTSPKKLTQKAEKLRQDARQTEQDLRQSRDEYRRAMKEKRFRDALTIKGQIADLEEHAAHLHKSAAKRYFASLNDYNPKRKHREIDVHGLRPSEALEKTEKALREVLKAGQSTLRVIVGKGLHSVNGQPILKGHITAAMQRQNIPCTVDPQNAGILNLTLPTQK